ncbi:MAG: chalcone isomerase family protein [Myxococcota bacterium]
MSLFAWLFASILSAQAKDLAGVTMSDTATVGGQSVSLNGMGLREKYFIDVYVGGLYLTTKTSDGAKAIAADEPKRIVMHFIYSEVPKDKVNETFSEGFAGVAGADALKDKATQLMGWMGDFTSGDEVVFDYVPGTGTTVTVKGVNKGTIAGADFMKALWSVYLGANPPTSALKSGMLGG